MIRKLLHIGIAVRDGSSSGQLFSRLLGLQPGHSEEVPAQGVRTLFFDVGSTGIELLEPISAESPVAKFIARRGEGIHHLSFEVEDIDSEISRLKQEGFQMIDDVPRTGADGYRVAFIHPRSTNGVLIEIGEKQR